MPSSTDLPTPEPANRPMRWPRPTVSMLLIERTPTSSVSTMGARPSGLAGRTLMGALSLTSSGPRLSSGRPAPSSTRPSSSGPTGRWRARSLGRRRGWDRLPGRGIIGSTGNTRVPGTMPSTSLCGIRNSRSPSKPTTSASTLPPLGSGTVQAAPTARRRPTASITSPATRVTRPDTCIGSTKSTSALQSFRYARQRPAWGLAEPSIISVSLLLSGEPVEVFAQRVGQPLPARRGLRVDLVAGGVDLAAAAADRGVLDDAPAALVELLAEYFAHQRRIVQMQRQFQHVGGDQLVGLVQRGAEGLGQRAQEFELLGRLDLAGRQRVGVAVRVAVVVAHQTGFFADLGQFLVARIVVRRRRRRPHVLHGARLLLGAQLRLEAQTRRLCRLRLLGLFGLAGDERARPVIAEGGHLPALIGRLLFFRYIRQMNPRLCRLARSGLRRPDGARFAKSASAAFPLRTGAPVPSIPGPRASSPRRAPTCS